MENYSLNKLTASISDNIFNMDMPGFDTLCDDSWQGKGEFDIEFEDCIVPVNCTIEVSFRGNQLDSRTVYINKILLQLPDTEKFLTVEEIKTIEEGLIL